MATKERHSDDGSRRRGGLRRAGLWLAGTVAVLLVLYLALILVLRAVVDPATLADRAEPYLSAALNRTVDVERAELSIFPRPEVRLLRVRVDNLPDFEGAPLATLEELGLRPRILPLLRRRIEIDRVEVVAPRVQLQIAQDGKSNFGDFVPASREEADPSPSEFSFSVRGIDIRQGEVAYRDAVSGRLVEADGLRATGSIERSESGLLELDVEGGSESVRLILPPAWEKGLRGLRVAARIRARLDSEAERLEIDGGSVAVNGLALEVSGWVDSLGSARRPIELQLLGDGVDLAELAAALPDSVRDRLPLETWGVLHADLTLRGVLGPDELPSVDGLALVRDAGVRRGDGPPLLDEASVEVRLAGDTATASGLRARLPGGEVDASGTVSLDSTLAYRWQVDASAGVRELADAVGRSGSAGVTPRGGTLRLDAVIDGSLSSEAAPAVVGTLKTRDLELAGGRVTVPIRVAEANIELAGSGARWSDVEVTVGEDRIVVGGRASNLVGGTPEVDVSASAERLNVDALLGPADSEIGYGRIAWARLGGRSVQGRSPEDWAGERALSRPGELPLRGGLAFRVDSLIRLPYRLADVRGRLVLAPGGIEIVETRFRAYGGSGTAAGRLDLGPEASEPFRLALALTDVRAEEYLAQNSPLGRLITGRLTMDVSLEGGLDTLFLPLAPSMQGVGRFDIRDGGIESNPLTRGVLSVFSDRDDVDLEFTRWTSPMLIRDGQLILDASTLAGSPLAADLTGALGFGGSLDLEALVRPDSALARAAAASDAVRRYLQGGGLLEIALHLTGQASDPRVELDPSAMRESARTVLEEAAEEAVRSGEADLRERGRQLLRGLLGGEEEAGAAADSAPSLPPDTAGDGGG